MSKQPTAGPIPFAPSQESGWEATAGAGASAMNVIIDGAGAVYRRPGIAASSLAPATVVDAAGICGLFVTNEALVLAVGNTLRSAQRGIYALSSGGALLLGGGIGTAGLRGTLPPVFAETELLAVIAGADAPQKVIKKTLVSDRLGGAPPSCSHVSVQSNRLCANDMVVDRTKVRYSDVALGSTTYAGHELWSTGIGGAGYFTAESRPDNVQAVVENTNELFVIGTGTTQTFQADPSLVIAPTSTIEVGLSAPYSVVKVDQKFMWLDQLRRFVATDGRSFQVLSKPIQRVLDEMVTTSDCFGYRVTTGFLDCLVWTFPTDGRTFTFTNGQWSQWSSVSVGNDWAPFSVTASATAPDRATTLVGTSTGYVGQLSLNTNTDLGTAIVASVTTGYVDRGTDRLKMSKAVKLGLRRGQDATNPRALLSWRDRPGAWQQSVPIDLGPSGDTEIVVTLRSLGTYRRRQWKFEFSGPETFVLASATEEFEVLDT